MALDVKFYQERQMILLREEATLLSTFHLIFELLLRDYSVQTWTCFLKNFQKLPLVQGRILTSIEAVHHFDYNEMELAFKTV